MRSAVHENKLFLTMGVSGKVAVVFGGARGIGEACVERLLRAGAKVME